MHSLNLPHWMWDVGVIFMPYSCCGFMLVGCPNGVLEELEMILKKLKLKQNFKLYTHNIYSDFRYHQCFVQTVYMTENHSSDKVVTV